MNWRKFALEQLDYFIKHKKQNIIVYWVSKSSNYNEIGKVSQIQLCEREIKNIRDEEKWQNRISIEPSKREIVFYDLNRGEHRDIKEIYNDLKNTNFSVSCCFRIIKKIGEGEYLVKLFDKYFLYKTKEWFGLREKQYWWVGVLGEDEFDKGKEVILLSKQEAVVLLL